MQQLLPSEEELPAVIESLSDLAGQSQVKIQTIFPQRTDADGAGRKDKEKERGGGAGLKQPDIYKEVIIQIDALAGFHQLGTFLSRIEQAEKPMRVASLRITQDPKEMKRQRVKLLLQSYFTPGAASDAQPRGPQ
jgi:Tfp pilus assembly protein PilO